MAAVAVTVNNIALSRVALRLSEGRVFGSKEALRVMGQSNDGPLSEQATGDRTDAL
ncbi:MAG: hypothetical protein ACFBSG_07175 [Leptolyngbyaceae cyanobacterium]